MTTWDGGVAPVVPGSLLFGSARALQRDQLGTYERAMHDYGDLVRFRIGPPRLGFEFDAIFDPEGARHVLSGASVGYVKDAPVFTEFRRIFGEGLASAEGQRWLRQRRTLQPLFTKRRVAAYVPLMDRRAQNLADLFGTDAASPDEPDLLAATLSYTLNVLGEALFGEDMATAGPIIAEAVPLLNQYAARRGLAPVRLPSSLPTPANRAAARAKRSLQELVDGLVQARSGGQQPDDFLGRLMEATDPDTGKGMAPDVIRDEVMIFLLAGHESTGTALAFTLYLLGCHEMVQDRVREEVGNALGDREPTAKDLEALPYTGQVVSEALRLYPPVHTLPRRATADDTLRGHPIPEGRIVAVSIWGIHRNAKVFEDPAEFRPERFEAAVVAERDRYAYLPFGAGPRACIGAHFALAELVIAVATVLRVFRIRSDRKAPRVTAGVTIGPRDRLRCTFESLDADA